MNNTAYQFIAGIINRTLRDKAIGFKAILDGKEEFIKNRFVSWVDKTTLPGFVIAYEYMNLAEERNAERGNKRIAIYITRTDAQRGTMLIEYNSEKSPHPIITVTGTTDLVYLHEWHQAMITYSPMIAEAIVNVGDDAILYPYTLAIVRNG